MISTKKGIFLQARTNKYNAKKTSVDNIVFDSKKESEEYKKLKVLQMIGQISDLQVHPEYKIYLDDIFICTVELDFTFFDHLVNKARYIDVKGKDNSTSALKRKLVEACHKIKVELF